MINSHALLFMLGGIFMTHEQFEKAADYWKNKGMSICAYNGTTLHLQIITPQTRILSYAELCRLSVI